MSARPLRQIKPDRASIVPDEIMLLILIPTAWIALAAFFVALAAMARRGDDALALIEEPARMRTSLGDLVVFERAPLVAARIGSRTASFGGPFASTRASARAGAVADRGGRCTARH
jgi:hypothetical protein